jgi:hypothetical protein
VVRSYPGRDRAVESLSSEFTGVPVRIVLSIFLGYLERLESVPAATEATRRRLIDACLPA